MSPTIYQEAGFRYYFFSREEARMHVHVSHADGGAKFWLEPRIELAKNNRLSAAQLKQIENSIRRHQHELISAWQYHFRN
jgi:hypothetical protein